MPTTAAREDRAYATKDGSIGWLTFENPARLNAISGAMIAEAIDIIRDFSQDPDIRTVIMRGAGEKAFISGGDISKFEETRFKTPAAEQGESPFDTLRRDLSALEKPLIAMIHGYCLGGGMGVALCADLRFGTPTAQMGIPAALRGVAYPLDGLKPLVDLVGPSRAKDIMMTGRRMKADEAFQLGLLNRIFTPETLEDETRAYAQTLAGNAPLSVKAAKVFIDQLGLEPAKRDHARIKAMGLEARDSEDFREATRSFMEKRKPVFKGR